MDNIAAQVSSTAAKVDTNFIIVSIHWGPNYAWAPSTAIQSLAHSFIDHGVNVIHGHSAHHVQGIEVC